MAKHSKKSRIHSATVSGQSNSPITLKRSHSKNRFSEYYRNHLLNFTDTEGLCIGEVFKGVERIAYCESVDIDSARQYCRQIVDEGLHAQSIANINVVPVLKDVIQAMLAIQKQIDEPCFRLLITHLKNNNKTIQIDDLKTLSGLHSTTDVFLKYAQLARLLCDELAYLPPAQASGQDPFLSLIISYQEPDINATSGLSISLKPVIFEALEQINTL